MGGENLGPPTPDEIKRFQTEVTPPHWLDWTPVALNSPAAEPFRPLLDDIAKAIASGDYGVLKKDIDTDAFLRQVEEQGGFKVSDSEQAKQRAIHATLLQQRLEFLRPSETSFAYRPTQFLVSPDRTQAAYFFQNRLVGRSDVEMSMGLVLAKINDQWRIVDLIDLEDYEGLARYEATSLKPSFQSQRRSFLSLLYKADLAIADGDIPTLQSLYEQLRSMEIPLCAYPLRLATQCRMLEAFGLSKRALFCYQLETTFGLDCIVANYQVARLANELGYPATAIQYANRYLHAVGPSGQAYYQLGLAYNSLDMEEVALGFFREGMRANPGSKDNLVALAIMAPDGELDEIVEWYQKGSDTINFEYVATALDEAECYDALRAIAREHRRTHPDDWMPEAYEALAYYRLKDYEKAADLFDKALPTMQANAPFDDWRSLYFDCKHERGELLEAFEQCFDPDRSFLDVLFLADRLKADELREVLDFHEKESPGQPALPLAKSLLATLEEDDEAADRHFVEHLQLDGDDELMADLTSEYLANWVAIRFRLGTDETALDLDPNNAELFQELAYTYELEESDESTAKLKRLVRAYRRVVADDPQLLYWDGILLARADKPREAAAQFEKALEEDIDVGIYESAQVELLRSLVAAKEYEQAMTWAEQWNEEEDDPYFIAMVVAGRRDPKRLVEVEAALQRCIEAGYEASDFYQSDLIANTLYDEHFAILKEKYPDAPSSEE